MYAGVTRKPIMAIATSTAATNTNPTIDSPLCVCRSRMVLPLSYAAAYTPERETGNVVPVEPDEERAPADMVVGDESPISAVVAVVPIVAHHEIVAHRHATREAMFIVIAVLAAGKWPHVRRKHGRRLRIPRDVMHFRC